MYDVNLNVDNLVQLFEGSEAVSQALLACLSEAAVLCLQRQGHNSPKEGEVAGDWNGSMSISWEQRNQEIAKKGWDGKDATEWGATVVALSLVAHENYRILERTQSCRDKEEEGGFDYWLGNNSNSPSGFENFDDRVKLEISGIQQGTEGRINQRIREKIEQVRRQNRSNTKAIILVVEFSNPKATVCQI